MCENTESVLVVLSAMIDTAVEFLEKVLEKHGPENTWIVVDKKTMEKIVSTGILVKIPRDRIIVYTGRKPEETTLRIYVISKPSIVYICDERGSLKPITDFLELAPVEVEKC